MRYGVIDPDDDPRLAMLEARDAAMRVSPPVNSRPFVKPTLDELIDLETRHPVHNGPKAEEISNRFGKAVHYYQHLNRVIRTPEALEHDPISVNRIIRALDERAAARASRQFHR